MNNNGKVYIVAAECMAFILVVGFCPVSGCLAADAVSTIRPITPAESAASCVDVRAEDYFDIIGTLNLIEGSRVVIGNNSLQLSGGANPSGISLYDQVGARLNQKGEVSAIVVISDVPN